MHITQCAACYRGSGEETFSLKYSVLLSIMR